MKVALVSFRALERYNPHSFGVLRIGSTVFNQSDHKVRLFSFFRHSEALEMRKLIRFKPDVVGLSSNVYSFTRIAEFSRRLRESINPLIVVGGPLVTYWEEKKPLELGSDVFIRGEGELAFLELLNTYEVSKSRKDLLERWHAKYPEGALHTDDFSKVSSPYINYGKGAFFDGYFTKSLFWETARGCAYKCAYCAHPAMRHAFRQFDREQIAREAGYFKERRVEAIYMTDPVLGGRRRNTLEVLDLISRELPDIHVSAFLRTEYLNDDLVASLEKARIGWLELGIQTFNAALGWIRHNDYGKVRKWLPQLRDRGVKFDVDLILGLPGDTKKTFLESVRTVIDYIRPNYFRIFKLQIYPGTEIYRRAEGDPDFISFDPDTFNCKSTRTMSESEISELEEFGNVFVAAYRYLSENNLLNPKKHTYAFFLRFYEHLSSKRDSPLVGMLFTETQLGYKPYVGQLLKEFDC